MSKIAVLTIGFHHYALPPKVDAAKLLAALSQAELVDSTHEDDGEVFFPSEKDTHGYGARMELRYVDSKRFLKSNPKNGPLRLK
jgi:hypothetical protein